MRALITGISGFVGSHLAEHLRASGAEVFGITRKAGAPPAEVLNGSILDESFLRHAVNRVRPTHVFHCAAVLGGTSTKAKEIYETNVIGTSNLFAAITEAGLQPVILVASSSAVYGKPESHPMTEDHAFAPLTDYGVSKVAQEMVARSYSLSRGTRVIVARAFNLIGPRQSEKLAASEFARQIALVERGTPGPVRVGNLTPRRDYTDIRDAVAAYSLLAGIDDPADVYNVCSNVSRPLQEALDILIRAARVPIDVLPDPHRSKETEIEDQVGCFDRLRKATGWQPKISFEQSLLDLLDDWRARVAADCPQ